MKKRKLLCILLAASTVVLSACGGGTSQETAKSGEDTSSQTKETVSTDSIADRDTLNIALADDIVSMDPAYSYDNLTNQVVNQVTQGLLYLDKDGQIQPQLCESWEVVDDTTYVYEIRDDVNFSDGSPMTMEDVLFSLNRHMDEDVASYLAWMHASIPAAG